MTNRLRTGAKIVLAALLWSGGQGSGAVDSPGEVQQLIEAAGEIANRAERPSSRVSVIGEVAAVQAISGDVDGAIARIAEIAEIDEDFDRASALGEVAAALASAGDMDGAKQVAARIEHSLIRSGAYRWIADLQLEAGDGEQALQTLRLAKQSAAESSGLRWRATEFRDIAEAQAKAGDFEAALETAAETEEWVPYEGGTRAQAYCAIATARANAGDVAGAKQALDEVDRLHDLLLSGALRAVVAAHVKSGDMEQAGQMAADIYTQYELLSFYRFIFEPYSAIAAAQAEMGDVLAAKDTARTIRDPLPRVRAYRDIAMIQFKAGDSTGARQTLSLAMEAAADVDEKNHVDALVSVAEAQVIAGDLDAAKQIAAQLEGRGGQRDVQRFIATAEGDAETLNRLIQELSGALYLQFPVYDALIAVLTDLAESGDIERARLNADAIESIAFRGRAYREIAAAQASKGDLEDVQLWAKAIDDPSLKVYIYIGAAEGLLSRNGAGGNR